MNEPVHPLRDDERVTDRIIIDGDSLSGLELTAQQLAPATSGSLLLAS